MKFVCKLKHFFQNEAGAVTVDWVILTAAVVALATVALVSIDESTTGLRDDIASDIALQ